jgi:hypothetical protein
MGSPFPRNAPAIDAHFLLQLNATYRARSFRVLPNLQSSYILCYTYSMWLIANYFLHFPDFVPFFSLSLFYCVGVFVAFLGRYSVSVTTKQTPFGSPSFSHISPLYGYTDLCTHACLQLFKMKPMHSEPLSLSSSSSSISRTNIEAGGRVYKRHGGKRKIIYKDTRNTYHQTAQTWATMPTRRQSEADQKRIFTHRRLTNTNTHTHSPRNTHTDAQEDEGRRQMEESV